MTSFSTIKITHLTTVIGRRTTQSCKPHSSNHIGDTIDEPFAVDDMLVERPTQPIIRVR